MDIVYWNRRVVSECRVQEDLCEADRIVAARESKAFLEAFTALLDQTSYSVNKVFAAKRAESKPLQLYLANISGLRTPETIVTNDPARIRDFVNRNYANSLAKPFSPIVWKSDDRDYVTRSAIVNPDLLPENSMLQACPMIFQSYVEKDFEVRITYFRDLPIAVRLDSQLIASARIDWRAVSPSRLGLKRIEIPKDVHRACLHLMRTLGLDFGCIDMIVTPLGEWVFLELNQMGQFLWIEEVDSGIPMLDLFVQLLTDIHRTPAEERLIGLKYGDFLPAACAELLAEQSLRVPKTGVNVVMEPGSLT
jgi:glutathione synthase/RimK-type ligase-like ATP-grasp enzyme